MGVSNGSVFLPLFAILGGIGLITSWFPKRAGETELELETGIGELNLEFSSELMYRGVASSLLSPLTFLGFLLKMRVQLRATSVMLALGRTVWRGLKISCMPITSTVMSGLIGPMMTGMIFGTNRLINSFSLNFQLVV